MAFLGIDRRLSRAVASLLLGAMLSACSGTSNPYSPTTGGATAVRPASSVSFVFQTVDDPASTVNAVNGINNSGAIAGTTGDGSASDPYVGYTSQPPYASFDEQKYSGAQGTVAMILSDDISNPVMAGYVINPPQLPGIWAFVRINGLWSLFRDRKGGKGPKTATEVLGINDSDFGVGFFKKGAVKIPIVLNVPLEKFNALKPPGSLGAEATGINDVNDIVGWVKTSGGVAGFFERAGRYYSLAYPASQQTQAASVNSQDQVAGSYQDPSGVTHGFLLSDPQGGSQQTWQSIDDPDAANGTVVTGLNDSDDICGYYFDANNVQHGFVAAPSSPLHEGGSAP